MHSGENPIFNMGFINIEPILRQEWTFLFDLISYKFKYDFK